MKYLEIAKSCGARINWRHFHKDGWRLNSAEVNSVNLTPDQLHAYTEQVCKQMVDALKVKAARWEKCKTMSKQWWINAMEEAGLKGGRSLDEQIDAAISKGGE